MKRLQLFAIVAAIIVLASCTARKQHEPLRFGIMPDADLLPVMVAQAEGLFSKEGVAVELVPFTNAQERDAAIQAGRVDGPIPDVLAVAFLVAGGFDMRITSAIDGRYGIVSAPGSGITEAAGLPQASYQTVAVPKMPVRLEMLLAGQIDAAGLPEPMLTAAVARGAHLVGTTDQFRIDAAVLVFSKAVLDSRLTDVTRFYKAYVDATDRIESDTDAWRSFLVEKASFPSDIKDAYEFVHCRKPILPSTEQITRVLSWLRSRGLLIKDVAASDLTDGRAIAAW